MKLSLLLSFLMFFLVFCLKRPNKENVYENKRMKTIFSHLKRRGKGEWEEKMICRGEKGREC